MLAIEKLPKREEGKGAAKVVLEAGGLRGRHTEWPVEFSH
jgi:hypothetical protein